jgi:vancomycin resistance protein YoaR
MATESSVFRSFGIGMVVVAALFGIVPERAHASGENDAAEAIEAELSGGTSVGLRVMGDERTTYVSYGRYRGRAHNVELAASLLDGAVLAPGQELSFNERVGARTEAAGFRNAPVIANGRLRTGVGGGVCQVATTLHVAALEAGLDIVERRAHTFPSHYVAAGLDATVVDGRVDFRVKNPHAHAVTVRAKARDGQLVVVVLGAADRAKDQIDAVVVREIEAPETVVADATLAAGERVVEDEGRDGQIVEVTRRRADGTVVSTERVRYAAAPRVVRVGG